MTMKKKSLLWISAFLLILAGCSSDDDASQGNGNVEKVSGGIVYTDGTYQKSGDESDPLSVFFEKELHNPYWDGAGNEYKTFFDQGSWDDESILVINSFEEFQKAYMGTKDLPDVNFNLYTLVIGRTWGNDGSFMLADIILEDKGANYELETKLNHYVDRAATSAIQTIFYWRLYPKLAQKPIVPKRIVIDVHG